MGTGAFLDWNGNTGLIRLSPWPGRGPCEGKVEITMVPDVVILEALAVERELDIGPERRKLVNNIAGCPTIQL